MSSVDRQEIKDLVYDYFSEECEIPKEDLSEATNIIEELEGDSLMLLSLLEITRKKYGISIELKTLGKHLMKRPADTIGEVINLTSAVAEHGDNILDVEL